MQICHPARQFSTKKTSRSYSNLKKTPVSTFSAQHAYKDKMSLKLAECQPVNSNHRTCFENLLQKYRFTEKSRMMTHAVKFGSANKHVFLLNTIFLISWLKVQ